MNPNKQNAANLAEANPQPVWFVGDEPIIPFALVEFALIGLILLLLSFTISPLVGFALYRWLS